MRPGWVSDELFPFQSRWATVDGHRLHHVDEGVHDATAPTLLMLHGNPTWSFVYRGVIASLRDSFRCVALDYPGFGLSEARAGYRFTPEEHARVVAEFVEQQDLRGVVLVAQDWGGPIGLWAAEQAPERFAGLVVANTWAWPVNGDLHFEVFSRTLGGPVGRELIRQLNLFVRLTVPFGHRRRSVSSQEMAHYLQALSTRPRRHASAVLPQAIRGASGFLSEVEAGLPRLAHLPALILWGDADVAFREAERARWRELLPRHTDVTLAGAGHFPQSDAPEDFAGAVRDWLVSLSR